jgi:hypothetical protein
MGRHREPSDFQFEPGWARASRRGDLLRRWGFLSLLVLAAAATGAYFYVRPASAPRWLRATGVLRAPAPTVVYRWRGPQGVWQITDQPPAPGVPHETLRYHHATNALPVPPGIDHRP